MPKITEENMPPFKRCRHGTDTKKNYGNCFIQFLALSKRNFNCIIYSGIILMSIMMKLSFFSNLTLVVGIHNKHSDPENIQNVQIIHRSNLLNIAREFYIFM